MARASKRGISYLLQGLIVCQCCQYAYYGITRKANKSGTANYSYYKCGGRDTTNLSLICGDPEQCLTKIKQACKNLAFSKWFKFISIKKIFNWSLFYYFLHGCLGSVWLEQL